MLLLSEISFYKLNRTKPAVKAGFVF
ncbi:hypothetical protein VCHC57A2_0642, partial [Vibrio cholerae HC-57A2]